MNCPLCGVDLRTNGWESPWPCRNCGCEVNPPPESEPVKPKGRFL